MKGEIDKDFYCTLGRNKKKQRDLCNNECASCDCEAYQRKWPTLAQYCEKHGEEWPDDGAVYCYAVPVEEKDGWYTFDYRWFKNNKERYAKDDQMLYCVCACTPWGKPLADWRPE